MFGHKRNRIEISDTNIKIQGSNVFIINSVVHLLTGLVDEKKMTLILLDQLPSLLN